MYDLFFLSHNEPFADAHWSLVQTRYPHARRIKDIDGILAAHKYCATQSRTSHFFVIDADNELLKAADLSIKLPDYDKAYVHIWRAVNPVNALVYGWGGIKLFPKRMFLDRTEMPLDMTMSFPLKLVPVVGSITHFNTSPFSTWRSAFRECVKLSRGDDPESRERLETWCTIAEGQFADCCLRGALKGREYGSLHKADMNALMKINDWPWLKEMFDEGN